MLRRGSQGLRGILPLRIPAISSLRPLTAAIKATAQTSIREGKPHLDTLFEDASRIVRLRRRLLRIPAIRGAFVPVTALHQRRRFTKARK